MLDHATSIGTEFSLTVHRTLPASWPQANGLGAAHAHIFQTREFLHIWAATYGVGPDIDMRFVDVRDTSGALLMRLPLCVETQGKLRTLSFVDRMAADYSAPILYPSSIDWTRKRALALWAAIETALPEVDLVRLERMPGTVNGLVNPLSLIADGADPESCHGSSLTGPLDVLQRTQWRAGKLRRALHRLGQHGPVAFRMIDSSGDRHRALTAMLSQKQRRYEETHVPGFAERPAQKQFFEQITEVYAAVGNLHMATLEVGGEILATSWGVSVGKTVYVLVLGFEAGKWAQFSPGRLLNLRMLEWAKEHGFEYVDYGIGDEQWKLARCDTHVHLTRLISARTARGRRALAWNAVISWLRETAIYRLLRPYKWIAKRALQRKR